MPYNSQLKLGPELISNSREAWTAYYVFVVLSVGALGGGYFAVRQSGVTGTDYWLLLLGVVILSAIFGGIAIMCHLLGHIIDTLDEVLAGQRKGRDAEPDDPSPR
ncbi:hypothetical protein IT570_10095 [Candidatus Sumerlaeota bacterium]|nr:hypothetical protein [Candidatus Sumerlaeota bacterium]